VRFTPEFRNRPSLPELFVIRRHDFLQGPTSFRLQNGDKIGITMNSRHTKIKRKEIQ
jgi:hypothetical protein